MGPLRALRQGRNNISGDDDWALSSFCWQLCTTPASQWTKTTQIGQRLRGKAFRSEGSKIKLQIAV